MVLERWISEEAKFERVMALSQIIVDPDHNECISMMFAKVTDNILMTGSIKYLKRFADSLEKQFIVSKVILDDIIVLSR